MAYIVVRTVKDRQYRYLQRSYRVGKKVRTVSEYLGPVGAPRRTRRSLSGFIGGLIEANRTIGPVIDEEAMLRDVQAKEAAYKNMIERFEVETGLKTGPTNPLPIERGVPANPVAGTPSGPASSFEAPDLLNEQSTEPLSQ